MIMSDPSLVMSSSLVAALLEWKKDFQAPLLFSAWDHHDEGVIDLCHLYPILCSIFPPPLLPDDLASSRYSKRSTHEESAHDAERKVALQHYRKIMSPLRVREAFQMASFSSQRQASLSSSRDLMGKRFAKDSERKKVFSMDELIGTLDTLCWYHIVESPERLEGGDGTSSILSSISALPGGEPLSRIVDNETPINDEDVEEEVLSSADVKPNIEVENMKNSNIFQKNTLCLLFGELERLYLAYVSIQSRSPFQQSKDRKWKSLTEVFLLAPPTSSRSPQLSVSSSDMENLALQCLGKRFAHHEAFSANSFFSSTLRGRTDTLKVNGVVIDFTQFLSALAGTNIIELVHE